jgi:DNA-binding YbaB/EbfC family protein
MKNLADIMKQAGQMQARMAEMQTKLEGMNVHGQAGGGLVRVVMTGKMQVVSVEVDPSLLKPEEKEIVEDLLVTALGDAKAKAEALMAAEMKTVTGGLPLPPGLGF